MNVIFLNYVPYFNFDKKRYEMGIYKNKYKLYIIIYIFGIFKIFFS